MDEPERQPPHAGERLTREDVLRLIEEHGGPEGLDLRQADLRDADLSELDLHAAALAFADLEGARLRDANLQGAVLFDANLQGADLTGANLQAADFLEASLQKANLSLANLQGAGLGGADLQRASLFGANLEAADLTGANLQGADLMGASLQKASLFDANLQGAELREANLQEARLARADLRRARLAHTNLRDANLEGVNWGDYVLGNEIHGNFDWAGSTYRALKQRHTELGMYDVAGEFFYREMEARRKLAWRGDPDSGQARRLPYASYLYLLRSLCGYGERPLWVIGWVVAVILGLAFVYLLPGVLTGGFLDALYYSAVSFTALGYGWAAAPQGWAGRFLGVGESLLGVFMMALFLVTFTRKMTR